MQKSIIETKTLEKMHDAVMSMLSTGNTQFLRRVSVLTVTNKQLLRDFWGRYRDESYAPLFVLLGFNFSTNIRYDLPGAELLASCFSDVVTSALDTAIGLIDLEIKNRGKEASEWQIAIMYVPFTFIPSDSIAVLISTRE